MLNMHVHMSLLEAYLGEHEVSRKLATESACMQQAVHFGPCRRANKLELQKISKCAHGLRPVKSCLDSASALQRTVPWQQLLSHW